MRFSFYLIAMSCFVFSLFSCKSTSSKTYVSNGIEDTNNLYPAVLELTRDMGDGFVNDVTSDHYGHCSSSVISHNTILTATHCLIDVDQPEDDSSCTIVKAKKVKIRLSSGKEVISEKYYLNDRYMDTVITDECPETIPGISEDQVEKASFINRTSDIAIVVFDDNTFSGISPLKISNQKIKVKDKVQLVGFAFPTKRIQYDNGEIDHDEINSEKYAHTRRYGSATIKENLYCEPGLLEIRSPIDNLPLNFSNKKDPLGVNAAIRPGDSGGPILSYKNQNLIIGLPSIYGVTDTEALACVLTFEKENINWLKKINQTTEAVIPLDEVKQNK